MVKGQKFNPKVFQRRFREVCAEKGLSQLRLAQVMGITQASISRFLGGYSLPRLSALFKIARGLGVSTDWLIGLKNRKR